jgi:hypothetical protein
MSDASASITPGVSGSDAVGLVGLGDFGVVGASIVAAAMAQNRGDERRCGRAGPSSLWTGGGGRCRTIDVFSHTRVSERLYRFLRSLGAPQGWFPTSQVLA